MTQRGLGTLVFGGLEITGNGCAVVVDVLVLRVHSHSERADATLELRVLAFAFTFPLALVVAVLLVPFVDTLHHMPGDRCCHTFGM